MERLKKIGKGVLVALSVVLKAALFLPFVAAIVWLNTESAEAAALRVNQYERNCAQTLLAGTPLQQYDTLTDERLVLRMLIENLEQPFNTVALGSSRILQMDADIAGVKSFYNCGVSAADYRDVMNTFYLFYKADMLPQNLIIGLDPWLLNADPYALHTQSDAALFEEFITLCLGYDTGWKAPPAQQESLLQTLDVPLFQDNLKAALTPQALPQPVPVAEGDIRHSSHQIKLPDGSVLYPETFRNDSAETVEQRARTEATTFLRMDDYIAPDEELCQLFDRFVAFVQGCGVQVVFVMTPYHPLVYNYATEFAGSYPGFFLTGPWFANYALQQDIPLYGSYNPFVAGCDYDDFYDGLHIRGEALARLFPGMSAVQKGTAQSRWYQGGPPVLYQTAEAMVAHRYGIEAPHHVLRGEDEMVLGEKSYIVQRWGPLQEGDEEDTLLALYAVTQNEGVVYRYATDTEEWVVDSRFVTSH